MCDEVLVRDLALGSWNKPVRMSFSQLPEFAVLSVPELADICTSLELLTDPQALGRIGVRAKRTSPELQGRTGCMSSTCGLLEDYPSSIQYPSIGLAV
jgi:hypothetical protein